MILEKSYLKIAFIALMAVKKLSLKNLHLMLRESLKISEKMNIWGFFFWKLTL